MVQTWSHGLNLGSRCCLLPMVHYWYSWITHIQEGWVLPVCGTFHLEHLQGFVNNEEWQQGQPNAAKFVPPEQSGHFGKGWKYLEILDATNRSIFVRSTRRSWCSQILAGKFVMGALHCTTLHYTALHCTTLCYTARHYTILHFTTLHYTALHCTTLWYTAMHCTTLI